jgi:hypothetical protein
MSAHARIVPLFVGIDARLRGRVRELYRWGDVPALEGHPFIVIAEAVSVPGGQAMADPAFMLTMNT